MNTTIKGIHLEVTDSLKSKINEEIADLKKNVLKEDFDKYSFSIDISVIKNNHICHILLVGKNKTYNVKKESNDMYKTISIAFETLKQNIKKDKTKKDDIRRKENIKNIIKNTDVYGEEIDGEYSDEEKDIPEFI